MTNTRPPLTLLLVDDEPDLREVLTFEFEMRNFHVLTAGGGREAFQILDDAFKKGHPIDVVLSDVRMAGGDGIELLAQIQRHHPETPVVLMTGYADMTARDAIALGAAHLVLKPFDFEELISAVYSSCDMFGRPDRARHAAP
jgi:DNA-binding NtrC family response regulator